MVNYGSEKRMGKWKEAIQGHIIKLVTTVGNWNLICERTLEASIEHALLSPPTQWVRTNSLHSLFKEYYLPHFPLLPDHKGPNVQRALGGPVDRGR